jgi:hypothetical protein
MAYRDMSDMTRIQYLRSEIVVHTGIYETATQLFSAYIANNQVDDDNEEKFMKKAVGQAIELALITERVIGDTGTSSAGGPTMEQDLPEDPFLKK